MPVDPDRVALPEVAGAIDPRTALPPQRRIIFEEWESQVRLPPEEWPRPLSRCLHTLPADKELGFAQEMRRRRMAFCSSDRAPS